MKIKTLIFICVAVAFASCATKRSSTAQTILVADSTEIVKLDSVIQTLKIQIQQQTEISAKEVEKLKSTINTKVAEKETDFTTDGKILRIKERNIDHSENTESEKAKELAQKLEYQQFVNESFKQLYIEQEQKHQKQLYSLQKQTEQKTNSNRLKWFLAGISFSILIEMLWKLFIKNRFVYK